MAVLNPPRVFPGLGRAIINFLIENRSSWDEDGLVGAFKPPGVNEDVNAPDAVRNTVSALRAVGVLVHDSQGKTTVSSSVTQKGTRFSRDDFRRLMLSQVFDVGRDGDPWSVGEGEAATYGARDLARALSWFLAQDAVSTPLRWIDTVQNLQFVQFATEDNTKWAISNDFRWGSFARWTQVLGLGVPSVVRGKTGLVPLPTLAITDVLADIPNARMPIQDFLAALSLRLPVLHGGVIRRGLVTRLGYDPDPGVQSNYVDTSIAQVLRILEQRGLLTFESLGDADGVVLSRSDQSRTTHVTLKGGKK